MTARHRSRNREVGLAVLASGEGGTVDLGSTRGQGPRPPPPRQHCGDGGWGGGLGDTDGKQVSVVDARAEKTGKGDEMPERRGCALAGAETRTDVQDVVGNALGWLRIESFWCWNRRRGEETVAPELGKSGGGGESFPASQ
jgi:hypothetical protein